MRTVLNPTTDNKFVKFFGNEFDVSSQYRALTGGWVSKYTLLIRGIAKIRVIYFSERIAESLMFLLELPIIIL